jgi:hypothetical protein
LKASASLHRRKGGKVLSVFFHSSELLPGGYPAHKTEEDVRRFLLKLGRFLSWLKDGGADPVTLSEVWDSYARRSRA